MKKILIIQTAFIGDVILATPIIEKLKNHFPDCEIDFLLRKGNESLLKGHPHLNELLIWNKQSKKYANLLALIKTVRSKNYDVVVNLQRFLASGLITAFSKGKDRIGFSKNPLAFTFTHKAPHKIRGSHETSRNLKLIEHLTDNKYIKPKLYPQNIDKASIAKYKDVDYLCVAPTSVWKTKALPMVKWIELILSLDDHFVIYLLGAPSDHQECEEIKQHSERKNVINLAGKISLLASAELMKHAKMNYVNDSAPMHLASSMDAPVNAVYCSTIPYFGFGPLSVKSKVIETPLQLNCRPCGIHGKKECPLGHFDCGHSIDVKQFDRPIAKKKRGKD